MTKAATYLTEFVRRNEAADDRDPLAFSFIFKNKIKVHEFQGPNVANAVLAHADFAPEPTRVVSVAKAQPAALAKRRDRGGTGLCSGAIAKGARPPPVEVVADAPPVERPVNMRILGKTGPATKRLRDKSDMAATLVTPADPVAKRLNVGTDMAATLVTP